MPILKSLDLVKHLYILKEKPLSFPGLSFNEAIDQLGGIALTLLKPLMSRLTTTQGKLIFYQTVMGVFKDAGGIMKEKITYFS